MNLNVIKRKAHTFFHTPRIIMKKLEGSFIFPMLSDKIALKIQYKNRFLKKLDLKSPKTFNEKLQWLKLYHRCPEYTTMVDKEAAKQYVASIIGEEYIIPTYGVWENFDDINFENLPNQFVMKCTHGSGDVVICKDKQTFDKELARKKINESLNKNYYKIGREWPYKKVKPQIIIEKFIAEENRDLMDYKLYCFHGEVKCCYVASERFTGSGVRMTFYDRDWGKMPFEWCAPSSKEGIVKPENYERMIEFAEKLSKNISFLRVDFYETGRQLYFGELTFFPASGFEKFNPEKWDHTFGSWIHLDKAEVNEI